MSLMTMRLNEVKKNAFLSVLSFFLIDYIIFGGIVRKMLKINEYAPSQAVPGSPPFFPVRPFFGAERRGRGDFCPEYRLYFRKNSFTGKIQSKKPYQIFLPIRLDKNIGLVKTPDIYPQSLESDRLHKAQCLQSISAGGS